MSSVGKGVPPPAKLKDVVRDLFQNEKINNSNKTITYLNFSRAKLNSDQKKSLKYPKGFIPLNFFIVYQEDTYNNKKKIINTYIQLVSFLEKDGFIYGIYFNVTNQPKFSIEKLVESSRSIKLSDKAIIKTSDYLEAYHDIKGTTVILSLSTEKNNIYATLQYSNRCIYYYEQLNEKGIIDPKLSPAILTGLSKNLDKKFQ